MVSPRSLDWPTLATTGGLRIVPVMLVAGVPVVIVEAGLAPTTTALTAGIIHPIWWPSTGTLTQDIPGGGTFDPVRGWLDTQARWTFSETARLIEGDVLIGTLAVELLDVVSTGFASGEVTPYISNREGLTARLLGSTITAAALSIPISGGTSGLSTTGFASIGRETIGYNGLGGGALVLSGAAPETRGKFGSKAAAHIVTPEHPPLVTFAGAAPWTSARHWQGRLATVWLCRLSDDGTTLYDPTLVYSGTVGAGVQLTRSGTRWSIPIDPITETLARKIPKTEVELYGVEHYSVAPPSGGSGATVVFPVAATYNSIDVYLTSAAGGESGRGFHPSWDSYLAAMNASADTAGSTLRFSTTGDRLSVNAGLLVGGSRFEVYAAFDTPDLMSRIPTASGDTWVSTKRAPEAYFRFRGRVRVWTDIGKIPATFDWSVSSPQPGYAWLTLSAKTALGRTVAGRITERDATSGQEGVVVSHDETDRSGEGGLDVDMVVNQRQRAQLGVVACGATTIGALRAMTSAIADVWGADLEDDVVDWDDLSQRFAAVPLGAVPQARRYLISGGDDTLLSLLADEARLRGMVLGLRNGYITAYRLANFSSTEATAATITETDLASDDAGVPIEPEVMDNTDPLATEIRVRIRGGSISYIDTTWRAEFGDAKAVECGALRHALDDVGGSPEPTTTAFLAIAQQLLGPAAEPQRIVKVTCALPYMGLVAGDLVDFTHPRVPTWSGARGVVNAVCQVQAVTRELFGGVARTMLSLRLASASLCGYAPEALVLANGLTGGSPNVTLDSTSPWGSNCFAAEVSASGAQRTNTPSDGFVAGDKVVLSQCDIEVPTVADEAFTVVSASGTAVVLDGNPSAGMVTAAASAYGVILRYDRWQDVVTAQQKYGFVADSATGDLGTGDSPKRWA